MCMREIKEIIVHCSDSPHGRGDDAATIHRWHLERGFSGVGYHWVILESGEIQAGRPEYWKGAHAKNYNFGSIGICLIGQKYFTEEQLVSLRCLINLKLKQWPGAKVMGHHDVDPNKTCPNFDVKKWLLRT